MNYTKELLPPPREYNYVGNWTEEEIKYLIEHPRVPTKVIAKRLGRRTAYAVRWKRRELKKSGALK